MKLLWDAILKPGKGLKRGFSLLILTILGAVLPGSAFAGEGDVVLNFDSGNGKMYLIISGVVGIISLIAAWAFANKVKKSGEGTEKMIEVSGAIREGAMAYLGKQIRTMLVFVVLLALALFGLYWKQYDSMMLGIWTALAFMGGVAASYVAGYVGMKMAVEGNKRTAFAALSSYKSTLEIAFQSGAVAGLVTVGMGLIGATIIMALAQAEAMKLLIGFGFGGSLAALFMRVGGGIFTKAADVGADLVGKVEAGIPEDDPRNPATIADNVGDNVGDCAGMAADVFESYEVTLVAAIVLGAATASIFDQPTWMKLVLFALMARAVGIIASIFGIASVKGSDDINSDPLMRIRRGFYVSALIAALGTAAVAYVMMGPGNGSNGIRTMQLKTVEEFQREKFVKIQGIRKQIADESHKKIDDIGVEDLDRDPRIKAMGLEGQGGEMMLQNAISYNPETAPKIQPLEKFSPINWNDPKTKVAGYATMDEFDPKTPTVQPKNVALKQRYSQPIFMWEVKISQPTDPKDPKKLDTRTIWYGPVSEKSITNAVSTVKPPMKVEWTQTDPKLRKVPAQIYVNPEGKVAVGIDATGVDDPDKMQIQPISYYEDTPEAVNDAQAKQRANPQDTSIKMPKMSTSTGALIVHQDVPWYLFFLAIFFGIVMAFAIEALTDYYVSTHKRPVQEVAGVSSAGPAPMIIQGFALAAESSVFLVFAIVIALLVPLFIFSPTTFGSPILSFYGIALVGLGLLTTTGFILAMDTFGPISDNAQGVFEMSGAGHESESGSKAVQRLDAAGNTTKALTKGFAIATAVVAAVALFHSFLEDAHLQALGIRLDVPEIFLGFLIGGAAPYLFSAATINAVGRAAFQLINEVRRQFKADAGIMKGTSKPDYGRCVAIVTAAAQRELIGPAILAIALPMAVAFGFSIGKPTTTINGVEYCLTGAQALGGFLAGAILSGQLLAVLLANSGGIWDNAKKLIEDGLYGGKGSEAHKAGVVCDTVGDPFKDTAGPALNPLIKVMNLVALLMATTIIKPMSTMVLSTVTVVCLLALAFSIWWSKRSSMVDGLSQAGAIEGSTSVPTATADTRKRITVDED